MSAATESSSLAMGSEEYTSHMAGNVGGEGVRTLNNPEDHARYLYAKYLSLLSIVSNYQDAFRTHTTPIFSSM